MSRKAEPVPDRATPALNADADRLGGTGGPVVSSDWTTRLADLVLHGQADEATQGTLQALWAEHATGDAEVDANRLVILGSVGRRLAQGWHPPMAAVPSPLPAWPDLDQSPLPQLHPKGLAGTSLVALCQDQAAAIVACLSAWLATGPDEVVLVDLSPRPELAALILARWAQPDSRLRVVEIATADVTPTQAWNAGLRLARHQRLICLCSGITLSGGLADRSALAPGQFGLSPGPLDGRGFRLDIDRGDLAAIGGFNEHLATMHHALDDLSARLALRGKVARHTGPDGLPDRPPVFPDNGTLRDALASHPALPVLRNRHIAALMPDWKPPQGRAFALAGQGLLGPRLAPTAQTPTSVPVTIRNSAETHALSDLVAARFGLPVLLTQRRLDMVLSRPVSDVCPLDIAVAGSHAPDAVKTRRAWLVVDISPDVLPRPGNPADAAFRWLIQHATTQGFSPVLRLHDADLPDLDDTLAQMPRITRDPNLTQGFWPATLSDLAQASETPLPHATLLFDRGFLDNHVRFTERGPAIFLRKPKLFIDAQHGLGNRLRSIASAAAIAEVTGRELIVVWQPDAHCDCLYEDLFTRDGAVLSDSFAAEAEAMGFDLFNYMQVEPGALKDQPIRLNATRDAYIRSAYPLVHPASTWDSENRALGRFSPAEVVRDLVASLGPSRPDLAVHIRMEGGRSAEHLSYEAPANWTAEAHRDIDHWRKRSHYSFFLPRIDQLVAEGQADHIFLATDTAEVYDILCHRYGDRIRRLRRPATDRSAVAMVHAFADAILLSRAPRILGSTWSSFTELAARLAVRPIQTELSGRDF